MRRWRPADVACVGGLVFATVLGYVATALTPALVGRHPVGLELLAGSTVAMVAAGAFARAGRAALLVCFAAPLLGVLTYDVFFWWAGRRYGSRLVRRVARGRRADLLARRSERFAARWGAWALVGQYYLPVPNALIQAAAGAGGLPLWRFVVADAVGVLLWEALAVGLGYAIGHPAVRLAEAVSRDALVLTLVLAAVLVGWTLARRRGRAARPAADSVDVDDAATAGGRE